MLKDFEAFQVATAFYKAIKPLKISALLREQLLRASSSIALNLAEGSGKRSGADQRRFYSIAFGSLRECQAILALEGIEESEMTALADRLAAMLFKLSRKTVFKE